MASKADYDTGTAALTASAQKFVAAEVASGAIPSFAQDMAQKFLSQMAAPGAKAVIDAVDAARMRAQAT